MSRPYHLKSQRALSLALRASIALYAVLFLGLGFLIGPYDYDHLSSYYDIAAKFWLHSGGVPHFNPYLCGGRTLGGDPQVPIFHPLVALTLIFGPTWIIKAEMVAQLAAGTWGLVRCLKLWNLERERIVWAVFLFLVGGSTFSRFLVGHVTTGFFLLFPLLLYFSYRLQPASTGSRKLFFWYTLALSYCTLYKPNFVVYGLPILACEATLRSLLIRNLRPLWMLGLGMGVAGLVNAASILPAWNYFSSFPRLDDHATKYIPFKTLIASLILPLRTFPNGWYGPVFLQRHEYTVCLGPAALWFAVRGLRDFRKFSPELISLVLTGALFALVGLGSPDMGISIFPYGWLRPWWPGFSSIRVPVRFWFATYLALIVLSARGFSFPRRKLADWGLVVGGVL